MRGWLIDRKDLSLSCCSLGWRDILIRIYSLRLELATRLELHNSAEHATGLECTGFGESCKWIFSRSSWSSWFGLVLLLILLLLLLRSRLALRWRQLTHRLWSAVWRRHLVARWHRHLLSFLLERLGPIAKLLSWVALVLHWLLLRHHIWLLTMWTRWKWHLIRVVTTAVVALIIVVIVPLIVISLEVALVGILLELIVALILEVVLLHVGLELLLLLMHRRIVRLRNESSCRVRWSWHAGFERLAVHQIIACSAHCWCHEGLRRWLSHGIWSRSRIWFKLEGRHLGTCKRVRSNWLGYLWLLNRRWLHKFGFRCLLRRWLLRSLLLSRLLLSRLLLRRLLLSRLLNRHAWLLYRKFWLLHYWILHHPILILNRLNLYWTGWLLGIRSQEGRIDILLGQILEELRCHIVQTIPVNFLLESFELAFRGGHYACP